MIKIIIKLLVISALKHSSAVHWSSTTKLQIVINSNAHLQVSQIGMHVRKKLLKNSFSHAWSELYVNATTLECLLTACVQIWFDVNEQRQSMSDSQDYHSWLWIKMKKASCEVQQLCKLKLMNETKSSDDHESLNTSDQRCTKTVKKVDIIRVVILMMSTAIKMIDLPQWCSSSVQIFECTSLLNQQLQNIAILKHHH